MKPHRLYIIMCILSLLSFAGCRDEEPVQSAEGKRTITVNLGIAMSRVALDDTDLGDDSQPTDMKVWIFEHGTGNRLAYITETQPVFSGSDALGELVNTKEYVVEVENEIQALDFYVVLNSENGTGLNLEEAATPSQIKEATFTGVKANLKDNQVPAYGCLENFDVSKHRNSYDVPAIKLTRAVGKLELFFTKENENSELMIKKVTLTKLPDKGYLVKPETYSLNYSDDPRTLFESEEEKGTEITAVLTETDASLGDFSQYQDDASKLQSLMSAYLLENPDGGKWAGTEDDGNLDYTYPENLTNVTDNRYVMTVDYKIGGTDKIQVVYLPAIERNVWNKIFARVKDDGKITFSYRVLFWEKEESQIGWDPESGFGYAYDAPMAAWRIYEKKVDADFRDAREGDEEATVCYVLNPRFGRSDNKSDHNTLVAKSSYAGFYFCMTKPKGAIWKACLTNTVDFELSTGGAYDSDGDGENDKHCVITGIAREEPYQIQVGAKNAWTKASEDEGDGYEGADTGWDDLTDWGKQIEDEDNTQYNRVYVN